MGESRYRFGPLERRGLIAGWRGGQIASVAGGLILAVLALRRPDVPGVLVALVAVGGSVMLACWPIAGRTGEEWLPTVAHWGVRAAQGGVRRPAVPWRGHRRAGGGQIELDGASAGRDGSFGGLRLFAARAPGTPSSDEGAGVIFDGRAGTYTAVLSLRGHGFALLGSDEKDHRVAGWSAVLASLAREHSVVHRLQWLASALPDDGRAVRGHLAERAALPEDSGARASYGELLGVVGGDTCRHDVHLAVQIQPGRAVARALRAAGGGKRGACAVLLREVAALRRQLVDADVAVADPMSPGALAALIRRSGESEPLSDRVGTSEAWPWPIATSVRWDCLRTDATWQATYWIAEWPRVEVGPEFLAPLLLGPVRRTVSVVMEPLSPSRATRQVEQARTADVADSELRRRGGFLPTARRAREAELVERREAELADGHASFRFSGYVTVTAPTPEQLAEICETTEQAAGQARLELRRLFGDQERGFACTLPLCRGLA